MVRKALTAVFILLAAAFAIFLIDANTYYFERWDEYERCTSADGKYCVQILCRHKLGEFDSGQVRVICRKNGSGEEVTLFSRKCSFDDDVSWAEFYDRSPDGVKCMINDYHDSTVLDIAWKNYF